MSYYGGNDAVNALLEFLEDTTGNRTSYNDELTLYRSTRSISSEALPNVQAFLGPRLIGSEASTQGVVCSVEYISEGEEDVINGRSITYEIDLAFYVPVYSFGGNPDVAFRASLHYLTVLRGMAWRKTYMDAPGYTLNNGGTTATGRVLAFVVRGAEMGAEPGSNEDNYMPAARLSVTLSGDYPGV
jgi:hypothetical protein